MRLRVAKGSKLPRDWRPGEPLTVGREIPVRSVQPVSCPFGPQCYSCRNGLRWDPAQDKHLGHRSRVGRGSRVDTKRASVLTRIFAA